MKKGAQHDKRKNTKCKLARKGHQKYQHECQDWHISTGALWQQDEHTKKKCVRHSGVMCALRKDASLSTR